MEGSSSAGSGIDDDAPGAIGRARTPLRKKSRVDHAAEERVIALVKQGRTQEALRILMTSYGNAITAFAQRILRQREFAHDVRQQVFLQAFQGLDKFKGHSSLWTWLCSIAYHRCIDEMRRNRRSGDVEDIDAFEQLVPDESVNDPERLATRRALERCLAKLPVGMRSHLLMRYFFGLSHEEIGDMVGISHSTLQVRISRILPRLRRCLRGEGVAR